MTSAGIVMAGGKGTRFGSVDKNKTAETFLGKPMVRYGTDLFSKVCETTVVVVGFQAESVKAVVGPETAKLVYAYQIDPKGTGDALRVGMEKIEELGRNPDFVFVGNGDHMMFYDEESLQSLLQQVSEQKAAVVLVSTEYDRPDELAWGRVVRNEQGDVVRITEQKDASEEERKIKEVSVNFFCFDYKFAKEHYHNLQPSPVTGEFYLPDMVLEATKNGLKVTAWKLPFAKVGLGVNTQKEKAASEELYAHRQ